MAGIRAMHPGKAHPVARQVVAWIGQPLFKPFRCPFEVCGLECAGVLKVADGADLTPEQTVKVGPNQMARAFGDGVAGLAILESPAPKAVISLGVRGRQIREL